jgi:hypothetical protein
MPLVASAAKALGTAKLEARSKRSDEPTRLTRATMLRRNR